MNTRRINLRRFCFVGDCGRWPGLAHPFYQDGYRIGAHGSLLVRTPSDRPDSSKGAVPKKVSLLCTQGRGRWRSWPKVNRREIPYLTCTRCGDGPNHCPACGDKGGIEPPEVQQIGDVWIAAHYDDVLRKLPNVKWRHSKNTTGNETCVSFRFDGGDGAVMPVVDSSLSRA